jgi:hypothetical protein
MTLLHCGQIERVSMDHFIATLRQLYSVKINWEGTSLQLCATYIQLRLIGGKELNTSKWIYIDIQKQKRATHVVV